VNKKTPPRVDLTINGRPAIPITGDLSRREAMQWVLAAVASAALAPESPAQPVGRTTTPQENAAAIPGVVGKGYGVDVDLLKTYTPGSFWPLILTPDQRKTATALADLILPKDHLGPAASELNVPAMVDEWVSAPYPIQQADRPVIVEGLNWIDAESVKRFAKGFAELADAQQRAIADDICFTETAKPDFKKPAEFFSRFRSLCAAAYYATPPGWKALGYVGNVALPRFDGPPPEVLQKLGVTQTVI
jgi:hypothetical protein